MVVAVRLILLVRNVNVLPYLGVFAADAAYELQIVVANANAVLAVVRGAVKTRSAFISRLARVMKKAAVRCSR